jgi:hypothetical protein
MNFENLFYQSTKVPNFGTLEKKKINKNKNKPFPHNYFPPPNLGLEMLFKIGVEQKMAI